MKNTTLLIRSFATKFLPEAPPPPPRGLPASTEAYLLPPCSSLPPPPRGLPASNGAAAPPCSTLPPGAHWPGAGGTADTPA